MPDRPALVGAAHGTRSQRGRDDIAGCVARVAAQLGVPHAVGYLDVGEPTLAAVLRDLPRHAATLTGPPVQADPVVVPLFLSAGYHIEVDLPAALVASPGTPQVAPVLGAADEVARALTVRVREVDAAPDAVVLATAGSSREAADRDSADVAALLSANLGVPVRPTVLSGLGLSAAEGLAGVRASGARRIVLAAHVLAHGFFHSRATAVAGDLAAVTAPLLGTAEIDELVARRYREVLG